jgi:fructuronate reductase
MKLDSVSLKDGAAWAAAGFELPKYDRAAVAAKTKEAPEWVHFGAGNIFRAFPAAVQQTLLDKGLASTGIVVAEGFDYEIVEKAYRPFDDLSALVVLKADGTIQKKIIGSVVESLVVDPSGNASASGAADWATDWSRLKEIFRAPSLKMASFTITEKGYSLVNAAREFSPDVLSDFASGPAAPKSIMAKVSALVHERYLAGSWPVTLASMDNCSHNGEKLFEAVHEIAKRWAAAKLVDADFLAYVENPAKVAFPWSMIDKITPRPDDSVRAMLGKVGFEDTEIIVTSKKTYTAAFVNAEEKEYLVMEDLFPNGRPALDKGGVIFTNRDTVDKVEKMKVCTCLNPLHTSLAIYGCLLGYTSIHDEMHDPELVSLIKRVGYVEGLPVVVNPGIMNPKDFIDDVVNVRLPNPFMPDTPQRIACDTSQKLPIRFGETVKAYMGTGERKFPGLKASDLKIIPLVFAGWCRYLMGIDDAGNAFECSPDPLLDSSRAHVAGIKLGDKGPFGANLKPLLSDAKIFGVDLYKAGLGDLVESYFAELVSGKGAVRATLKKYVK